jgi:hypothetical protein
MTEVEFSGLKVGNRVVYQCEGEQPQPGKIVDVREDEDDTGWAFTEVEIDFDDGFTAFTITDDACDLLELER